MHIYKWLTLLLSVCSITVESGWFRRRRRCSPTVNCRWSSYGPYGRCSTTSCGVLGTKIRTRSKISEAKCGGAQCTGSSRRTAYCYGTSPRDCTYNTWSAWGRCNMTTCGQPGHERRDRSVRYVAGCGGNSCEGDCKDLRDCVGDSPVHCEYSSWSGWSTCNESICGVSGTQDRNRTISIPAMCGGRDCTAPSNESQSCYGNEPRDCIMCEWSKWSPCTQKTCDSSGTRYRSREVTTEAGCGGQNCTGQLTDETTCTKPECMYTTCKRCSDSPCEKVGDSFCHKTDVTKYVVCVSSDACLESQCEAGKEFNATTENCEKSSSVDNAIPESEPEPETTEGPGASECYDCDIENPCATGTSDYYCHPDPAFYVHCSVGSCYKIQCATGTTWNNQLKTCSS